MIAFHPAQQQLWRMGAFPYTGGVFIGFGQSWVDMDGGEDLVQTDAVAHRKYELDQQIGGVFTHDGDTHDSVAVRLG